jgi:hypothetical protein
VTPGYCTNSTIEAPRGDSDLEVALAEETDKGFELVDEEEGEEERDDDNPEDKVSGKKKKRRKQPSNAKKAVTRLGSK